VKRKLLIPLDGSDFSLQIVRVVVDFFDPRDSAAAEDVVGAFVGVYCSGRVC